MFFKCLFIIVMPNSAIPPASNRSRTLKDLNDAQLSKIIDSMEEVIYLTIVKKHLAIFSCIFGKIL